jgi:hypothetical protein
MLRIDRPTATAMPASTPSRTTPRKAAADSKHSAFRCSHSRTTPGMSASESKAVITTAASAGWGRLRNKPGTSTIMTSVPPYPASHGCVRMTVPTMDLMWSSLWVGMPVAIYSS